MSKQKNPLPPATAAQVSYTNEGRSGTVHYVSQEASFDMWYELAGGKALAIINIPTAQYWEELTRTSLSQRAAILQFIGESVLRDQVSTEGYFLIEDDFITIYTGKNPLAP